MALSSANPNNMPSWSEWLAQEGIQADSFSPVAETRKPPKPVIRQLSEEEKEKQKQRKEIEIQRRLQMKNLMKQGRESKPVAQVNENPNQFEVENNSPVQKKSRVSDEGMKDNKENAIPNVTRSSQSGSGLRESSLASAQPQSTPKSAPAPKTLAPTTSATTNNHNNSASSIGLSTPQSLRPSTGASPALIQPQSAPSMQTQPYAQKPLQSSSSLATAPPTSTATNAGATSTHGASHVAVSLPLPSTALAASTVSNASRLSPRAGVSGQPTTTTTTTTSAQSANQQSGGDAASACLEHCRQEFMLKMQEGLLTYQQQIIANLPTPTSKSAELESLEKKYREKVTEMEGWKTKYLLLESKYKTLEQKATAQKNENEDLTKLIEELTSKLEVRV